VSLHSLSINGQRSRFAPLLDPDAGADLAKTAARTRRGRIEYHKIMATITKTLYDTDFAEWTAHTAELLRQGKFDEIDLEHVVEEIEDMGKRDFRAARSQLRRMLMHLIKQQIQPERDGTSWRGSIVNARQEIRDELRFSPSLRRRISDEMEEVYREAVEDALEETNLTGRRADLVIPDRCPFTLSQLLDSPLDSLRF
jgi:hypothetical protein